MTQDLSSAWPGHREGEGETRAALLLALREMSGASVLFSQAMATRLGMTTSDLECLSLLITEGSMTAGELAEAGGLSTGAITGVIDRLEAAGHAVRQRDTTDRRRVHVLPRQESIATIAPMFGSMVVSMSALFDRYSDDQLALVLAFCRQATEATREETHRLRE